MNREDAEKAKKWAESTFLTKEFRDRCAVISAILSLEQEIAVKDLGDYSNVGNALRELRKIAGLEPFDPADPKHILDEQGDVKLDRLITEDE